MGLRRVGGSRHVALARTHTHPRPLLLRPACTPTKQTAILWRRHFGSRYVPDDATWGGVGNVPQPKFEVRTWDRSVVDRRLERCFSYDSHIVRRRDQLGQADKPTEGATGSAADDAKAEPAGVRRPGAATAYVTLPSDFPRVEVDAMLADLQWIRKFNASMFGGVGGAGQRPHVDAQLARKLLKSYERFLFLRTKHRGQVRSTAPLLTPLLALRMLRRMLRSVLAKLCS